MFNEALRVLAPGGLLYLNASANGDFYRLVDCWRFYPDAGAALARWGQHGGFACVLLESFTAYRDQDIWNDQVARVFLGSRRAGPPSLSACWSVSGAI